MKGDWLLFSLYYVVAAVPHQLSTWNDAKVIIGAPKPDVHTAYQNAASAATPHRLPPTPHRLPNADISGHPALEPLLHQCFELKQGEYLYGLCPFRNVTQKTAPSTSNQRNFVHVFLGLCSLLFILTTLPLLSFMRHVLMIRVYKHRPVGVL